MSQLFQPISSFKNFKVHLNFVSYPAKQPDIRPTNVRCMTPEISHNKSNHSGCTLYKTTVLIKVCPVHHFILHYHSPCSSSSLKQGEKFIKNVDKLLITSHKNWLYMGYN